MVTSMLPGAVPIIGIVCTDVLDSRFLFSLLAFFWFWNERVKFAQMFFYSGYHLVAGSIAVKS